MTAPERLGRLVWLGAALALTALWMARSLAPSLDPLVVQDDARQHVFWMQRLVDPSLLCDDLYADYFASQAPSGFVLLFRGLLLVAEPLTASKLLPPVLGLVAALFTFLLVDRLYPSRPAAFLATVLSGWYVWQYDDLPTGSPRAFLLPLTAMLLYALVAGWRWWLLVLVVAIQALVYPSAAALGVALVGARLVACWPPRVSRAWHDWRPVLACGAVAGLLLAPTVLGGSAFGPTVDVRTARTMPEFGPNGRNAFFTPDPYAYWIASYRSGFDLRVSDALIPSLPIFYELLALACALPLAMVLRRRRPGASAASSASPLERGHPVAAPRAGSGRPGLATPGGQDGRAPRGSLASTATLVCQVVLGSLLLFLAAHVLLFRLYLPARFVAWTVPLALAIAAGVGIAALIERLAGVGRGWGLPVVAALLAGGLALYPAHFDGNFVRDPAPSISAYLRSLPPETIVLAPPIEADSIPTFSGRGVLMNREYALAYHLGFYREVERRVRDGIAAYYAEMPRQVVEQADRLGVRAIVVDPAAFDPSTAADVWAGSFEPYTSLVLGRLQGRQRFALLDERRRCGAISEGHLTVIPVACLRSRL